MNLLRPRSTTPGSILITVLISSLQNVHLAAQVPDTARISELERKLDAVTRELERMQLGEEVVQADSSARARVRLFRSRDTPCSTVRLT